MVSPILVIVVTSGDSSPKSLKVCLAWYTSSVALVSTGLRLMYFETSNVCILRPPRPPPPRCDEPRPPPPLNGLRPPRSLLEKARRPPLVAGRLLLKRRGLAVPAALFERGLGVEVLLDDRGRLGRELFVFICIC